MKRNEERVKAEVVLALAFTRSSFLSPRSSLLSFPDPSPHKGSQSAAEASPMDPSQNPHVFHATTIVSVRRGGHVAVAGDGQVTLGNTVMKSNARKIRRLGRDNQVIAGFAGAAADAFTLFELFEAKLEKHGQLTRAAVEMAKDWRTERRLGKLEALLAVADRETSLVISGTGDVIEPDDGIIAIGSGGMYALSAARALMAHTELDAKTMATEAIRIAGEVCIYTNGNVVVEEI